MPGVPRGELEEMLRRYLEANDRASQTGDWKPLARFYTEDAVYSWNNGARHEFVARGRDRIRDWVFGSEMEGLENWRYPYVRTLIDERKAEVIGIWRQVAPLEDPEGMPYEIAGTGGSWFRYAGSYQWAWQRDFFDTGNAAVVFKRLAQNDQLSKPMQRRMKRGSNMPGWVRIEAFDWYETIVDREA